MLIDERKKQFTHEQFRPEILYCEGYFVGELGVDSVDEIPIKECIKLLLKEYKVEDQNAIVRLDIGYKFETDTYLPPVLSYEVEFYADKININKLNP